MSKKTLSCDYLHASQAVACESLKVKGKNIHEVLELTPEQIQKLKAFLDRMTEGFAPANPWQSGDELVNGLQDVFNST